MLPRGVLREAATSDLDHVRSMFETLSGGMTHHYLQTKGISFERFARALSQARIQELEDEVGYYVDEVNRAKGLI